MIWQFANPTPLTLRRSVANHGSDAPLGAVARAIDGAAPNRPAKLFGRKVSPSAANADTAIPPARNRKPYSSIVAPWGTN